MHYNTKRIIKDLWKYNEILFALLLPTLTLPIIAINGKNDIGDPGCCTPSDDVICNELDLCEFDSADVARFSYCLIVMATFWITECIPIASTALLPYALYPLFGLADAGKVAPNYMKNTNFLFMGSMVVAVAVETSNLHRRIALGTLKLIGGSPRRLMAGFMFLSWFMSMWISNTATTAMMIPIVLAVLKELKSDDEAPIDDQGERNPSFTETELKGDEPVKEEPKEKQEPEETDLDDVKSQVSIESNLESKQNKLSSVDIGLILCVPFASSVGGTGTLTGTTPNLILQEMWQDLYPDAPYQLGYTEWMGYNIINAFVMLLFLFAYLQIFYMGFKCNTVKSSITSAA